MLIVHTVLIFLYLLQVKMFRHSCFYCSCTLALFYLRLCVCVCAGRASVLVCLCMCVCVSRKLILS